MNNFKVVSFWAGHDNFRKGADILKWSCDQFNIDCEILHFELEPKEPFWRIVRHKPEIILDSLNEGNNVLFLDADSYIADGKAVLNLLNSSQFASKHIDCAWNMFKNTSSDPTFAKRKYAGLDYWPATGAFYFANTEPAKTLLKVWRDLWDDPKEYEKYSNSDDQLILYDAWKQTTGVSFYNLPAPWYQMPNEPTDELPITVQGWWKKVPGVSYEDALNNWQKYVKVINE